MSWYGGVSTVDRIAPDRMGTTFANQQAAVLTQMSQQVPPSHGSTSCGVMATRDEAVSNR